jgi:hypothetical protein
MTDVGVLLIPWPGRCPWLAMRQHSPITLWIRSVVRDLREGHPLQFLLTLSVGTTLFGSALFGLLATSGFGPGTVGRVRLFHVKHWSLNLQDESRSCIPSRHGPAQPRPGLKPASTVVPGLDLPSGRSCSRRRSAARRARSTRWPEQRLAFRPQPRGWEDRWETNRRSGRRPRPGLVRSLLP